MNISVQGDKAVANSDWPAAIRLFTDALIELPHAPAYYIKRSTAYSRRKPEDGGPDFHSALRDAEIALQLARERGRREVIIDAQMRRAITLYQLERYGDAEYLFNLLKERITTTREKDRASKLPSSIAPRVDKHEQELSIWAVKVKGKLSKLEPGSEKAAVTVKEYPEKLEIPDERELRKALEAEAAEQKAESGTAEEESHREEEKTDTTTTEPPAEKTKEAEIDATGPGSSAPLTAGPAAPAAPASEKIRHEWYQSNDTVVVTLYAKGVPKDKLEVDLQTTSISIRFPRPSGAMFAFTLDPLYAPIDTAQSKVAVLSTKLEIVLRKQTAGQKWNTLEASSTSAALTDRSITVNEGATSSSSAAAATSSSTTTNPSAPAYPTSSRHGVKDWDKLASDLTSKKKKKKDKAKDKGSDSDKKDDAEDTGVASDAESVDSDYASGDPVDGFFKKLYANADPDTRRAMVKSYYESEGTALSTNWDEVGKGKVAVRPPSND